jgi:hypothetical protein
VLSFEKKLFVEVGNICRSLLDKGMANVLYLPFSLTKYSAIFAVKQYFGIYNNQLGRFAIDDICGSPFGRNEINNQLGTVSTAGLVEIWSKLCSLRSQGNWCLVENTCSLRSWNHTSQEGIVELEK